MFDFDLYSDDRSPSRDVVVFVLHHPYRPEHRGTPIFEGGFSCRVDSGVAWGQKVNLTFSNGKTEECYAGNSLDIYPIRLAAPFTIVEKAGGERLYIPKRYFIKRDDVPEGYSVKSARSLVFVVADDPSLSLCAMTFKSFNSDTIYKAFNAFHSRVNAIGNEVFKKPLAPFAVRAQMGVTVRQVGEVGKIAYISEPVLSFDEEKLRKTLIAIRDGNEPEEDILANSEVAAQLREYYADEQFATYPFNMERTKPYVANLLPWEQGFKRLAAPAEGAVSDAEYRSVTADDMPF